jgi:hypothetical protein
MSYFDKYIKYKNKYNSLKQSGGANVNNQRGGADNYQLFVVVNPDEYATAHLEHFKSFLKGSIEQGGVNNLDYYVNYWRFDCDGEKNFYVNLDRIKNGKTDDKCIEPLKTSCFYLPYMNNDRSKELNALYKIKDNEKREKEKENIMKKHKENIAQTKKNSNENEKIINTLKHYNEVTDYQANQSNKVKLQEILSHITEKDKVEGDDIYFPIDILFINAGKNKLVTMVVKINDWKTADELVHYRDNLES